MKQAVVFYSRDGSTRAAAQVMGEKFGADIYELEPKRAYSKAFGGFMRGGFGAAFGLKPAVKDDFSAKMGDYDNVYIGTPIWAGKPAPPVNTFLGVLEAKGKEIVLFSLQADPTAAEPSSGMMAVKAKLEAAGANVSKVVALFGAGVNKTATAEEMAKRIDEKF